MNRSLRSCYSGVGRSCTQPDLKIEFHRKLHAAGGQLFQYKQQLVQKVVETNKFYVWLDIVQGEPSSPDYPKKTAVLEYHNDELLRFFTPEQKQQLESMRAHLLELVESSPGEYPYLMALAEESRPVNLKVNIRGNAHVLGDEVPRAFPPYWPAQMTSRRRSVRAAAGCNSPNASRSIPCLRA